ncbi:hypothetical protein [Achromobacter piechaudii]|uniref:hypothetical protein n=1 Tax=Achromobacter piechaudii TaxID=72556 RepID=UPI00146855E2|nr:hypothetical protein [Achromobacter piechaudii]CAB3952655.1 hypothetical protein LMG6103_03514 [Achromobacter piechaudii]
MNIQDFDAVAAKLAGVLGAIVSMGFLQGTPTAKVSMAATGTILAYYCSPWLSDFIGIPEGLSGFLCGFLGMAVMERMWRAVQEAPIGALWQAILDRVRGKGV